MSRAHLEGRDDFLPAYLLGSVEGKPGIGLVEQAHLLADTLRHHPLLHGGTVGGVETKLGFGPFMTTGSQLADKVEKFVVKGKKREYVQIARGWSRPVEVEQENVGQLSIHDELALIDAVRHMTQDKLPPVWNERWNMLVGEIKSGVTKTNKVTSPQLQPSIIPTLAPVKMELGQIRPRDAMTWASVVAFLVSCGLLPKAAPTIDASPGSSPEPINSPLPTPTMRSARPTVEAVASPTEVVVVGYGGAMNEVQRQCLTESKVGKDMIAAFSNYLKYWQKFRVYGPGTSLSYVPVLDSAFADDPEKCTIMAEIYGDPNYPTGFLVGLPFDQVRRYMETGDPDQLLPPQGSTVLEKDTDPARLSKQVGEGSAPALAGIPLGARLEYWNGQFVYVVGPAEDAKIVGKLNTQYQWEVVKEVNMTWEDWKEMFDFMYTYTPTGEQFDVLSKITSRTKVLTSEAEISALRGNPNLILLSGDGHAQCMATPTEASAAFTSGATILEITSDNVTTPGNVCNWILRAQNASYLAGNHNVSMSFGETPRSPLPPGIFWIDKSDILVVTGADGRYVPAVLARPPHYTIGSPDVAMVDSALPTDSTEHWVEEVLTDEYSGIYVYTE